jgi:aspartate-semialdehyde dehydrogenase
VSKADSLPRIAVVGASTLIGEALLEELRSRQVRYAALHVLDEERHLGRTLSGGTDDDRAPSLEDVAAFDFARADLVFFCGRAALAERYAESAAQRAWVIDGSAAFRTRPEVPLIVADLNASALEAVRARGYGLVALPGSASVALATALAPLHALAGVLRVDVATYQAVSGNGRAALEELAGETVAMLSGKTARGRAFGRQIAFNVIPQVDTFESDGVSREERRLWEETRRVLNAPQLVINATAVRVPVFFGHSLAVHALCERPLSAAAASAALGTAAGISLIDADSAAQFPTPATLAMAPDKVYVGRLRVDPTRDRALNFWIVADNVRKCAAHNAVSTAQILVNSGR